MVELGLKEREGLAELATDDILVRQALDGKCGRVWVPATGAASYCVIKIYHYIGSYSEERQSCIFVGNHCKTWRRIIYYPYFRVLDRLACREYRLQIQKLFKISVTI